MVAKGAEAARLILAAGALGGGTGAGSGAGFPLQVGAEQSVLLPGIEPFTLPRLLFGPRS
jgi:hypothetical protein